MAPIHWNTSAGDLSFRADRQMTAPVSSSAAASSLSASRRRLTLVATILGSSIAILDGSVVSVALPSIQRSLGGGLAGQQWVSNAYLLTLGSLILLGGSLGDIFGERRVFAIGVGGFGAASLLCALAPSIGVLIAFRALQGVAGALLTPSSLAVIVATFPEKERGPAIGTWTAWGTIAGALGPLVAGLILNVASWRWIFVINVPLVLACLWLILKAVPAGSRIKTGRSVDVVGALLCVLGLGGTVFALIEQPRLGLVEPGGARLSDRRRAHVRRVPDLRITGARPDATARPVQEPKLRGRKRRDARAVRRPVRVVLLPRPVPAASRRLLAARVRAGVVAREPGDVRAVLAVRCARRSPGVRACSWAAAR